MAHVTLDESIGATLIGLIFASILFGITNVQSLVYYQNSPGDPAFMKGTIAFLWSLDSLHLALISHVLYFYLVTNFANLEAITVPSWSLCSHVLVTTLSDFVVRIFYAWRVWVVSGKNRLLTFGVLVFTSVTFVSGMGFGIKIFSFYSSLEFAKLSWVLYTSLGSAVAADAWMASSLCFFLARNKTGFRATDTTVKVLIVYVINTGLFTSLCATACFVSFTVLPHSYIFIAVYFSLPKLYFNALLGSLIARERLREGLHDAGSGVDPCGLSHILTVSSSIDFRQTTTPGTVNVIPDVPSRAKCALCDAELPDGSRTEMTHYVYRL